MQEQPAPLSTSSRRFYSRRGRLLSAKTMRFKRSPRRRKGEKKEYRGTKPRYTFHAFSRGSARALSAAQPLGSRFNARRGIRVNLAENRFVATEKKHSAARENALELELE